MDLETTLVSGSSYFSYVAVAMDLVLTVADVVMTAYGSLSYCSAVADSEAIMADVVADAAAIMVVSNSPLKGFCFIDRSLSYFLIFFHIFC